MEGWRRWGCTARAQEKLSDGPVCRVTFLGVVLAAFCSLYLGTEYQDGTLRNKVTAGYRREQIYFSCLLACLGGGLLIWGSYLAAYAGRGTSSAGRGDGGLGAGRGKLSGDAASAYGVCLPVYLVW